MAEGVGVSDEQLDEWERLANEATPGPWSAADEHGLIKGADPAWCVSRMRPGYEAMSPTEGYLYDIAYTTGTNEEPDADFIAAAREALPALIGEVRASHAREAEAVADRDELMAEVTTAARRIREAEAERDVLQQRIDKALVALEETVRYDRQPTMDFSSTDALYNQFTSYLERVEQSWAQQATAVRAALTGTGEPE